MKGGRGRKQGNEERVDGITYVQAPHPAVSEEVSPIFTHEAEVDPEGLRYISKIHCWSAHACPR